MLFELTSSLSNTCELLKPSANSNVQQQNEKKNALPIENIVQKKLKTEKKPIKNGNSKKLKYDEDYDLLNIEYLFEKENWRGKNTEFNLRMTKGGQF